MDGTEKRGGTCYIGETQYSAGIFLSRKIAERKTYYKYLRMTAYESYALAEEDFFTKYGDTISKEEFRVNHLFEMRDKAVYSVYSTPHYVGLTYTSTLQQALSKLPSEWYVEALRWSRNNLTYEEAQKDARNRFVKIWKNPRFYIGWNLRVHSVVALEDVKRDVGKNHFFVPEQCKTMYKKYIK